MPRQVVSSLSLLSAAFSTSILRMLLTGRGDHPGSNAVAAAIVGGIYFAWVYGLFRRLNWLRWVTIVLTCVGVITLPWWFAQVTDHTRLAFHLLQLALQVPAVALLCLRPARVWYGRPTVA